MTPRRILLFSVSALALASLGFVFIRNLIDFPAYYSAGQSLISGRTDLYAPDFAIGRVMDYRYPPLFLVIFIPLWLLPYPVAAYLWYLLSIIQIVICVLMLRKISGRERIPASVKIISILALAQYSVMILHYGNAHLMAIFLLFVSLYYFLRDEDLKAALPLALSITVKLTPVLILPYFALRKRWRLLALTSVFFVAMNVIPSLYFGFEKNTELFKQWADHVLFNQEFHEINGPINLSLKGQLRRYLTDVDYTERVDGDIHYPSVNFLSLGKESADTLWMSAGSAVYLLGLYIIWRGLRRKTSENENALVSLNEKSRALLELGLMICLMLFTGPLTSKIYFIALLWPVFFLSLDAFDQKQQSNRFSRAALIIISTANLVLPLLPGSSIQRLLLVLGADFYVNLLLMASLAFALVSIQFRVRASDDERRTPVP